MQEARRSAHTVYTLHYHFVFITKYRKPVLRGDIGTALRDLIREICRANEIEILQGHIRPDHVHLLVSAPPHLSPSRVMQAIKVKTSHHLLQDHRRLRIEFWGRHLWARGYFVATSGNVTDDVIAGTSNSKGANLLTKSAFELPSRSLQRTGRRPFSRLQSTVKPSPSGEGI